MLKSVFFFRFDIKLLSGNTAGETTVQLRLRALRSPKVRQQHRAVKAPLWPSWRLYYLSLRLKKCFCWTYQTSVIVLPSCLLYLFPSLMSMCLCFIVKIRSSEFRWGEEKCVSHAAIYFLLGCSRWGGGGYVWISISWNSPPASPSVIQPA